MEFFENRKYRVKQKFKDKISIYSWLLNYNRIRISTSVKLIVINGDTGEEKPIFNTSIGNEDVFEEQPLFKQIELDV